MVKADIVDYMGLIEDGVLVLLSINFNGSFYEGTIFYSEKDIILTVDSEIEDQIGPIENWDGYENLLKSILNKLIPYNEIKNRLDLVNFQNYVESQDIHLIDGDVDSDEISMTYSVS
jgi:hypothetical protein